MFVSGDGRNETDEYEKDTTDKIRDLEKKLANSLKVINEMQEELQKVGVQYKPASILDGIRKSLQSKII